MPLNSLRLQLLGWLLVPLAVVVAVNTWAIYTNAIETATVVQDRMLLGAVRIIAEQTYYKDGELHVEVPPAALELFESSSQDRVFYRVASPRGALLLGYAELPAPQLALAADETRHFDAVVRGEAVRVAAFAQPMFGPSAQGPVLIEVAQTMRAHRALASQIWKQAVRQELLMLALAIALVWLGLRRGLMPVLRLRDQVLRRKPGTLEPLDAASAPRELTPLADAMNDYVRRLDEHMSAHGRFIAYASHQLRTVLTVLNTQVSYALGNADPAAREDALRGIRDGVQQGIRLVNQLLLLFTAEAGAAQPLREAEVDLAEVVQRVLEELAALAQARNIDLGFERKGEAATVRGTPSMLHELVANLVDNAIRYTPPGGVVTAAVLGSTSGVTLCVEDNGPGIPAEQRERVFERFYRLHDDGPGGSGLGLPIVREIAAASRADVRLSDPPSGNGLVVSVTFN
jgi:two-component system sensor histidine kinase TctE